MDLTGPLAFLGVANANVAKMVIGRPSLSCPFEVGLIGRINAYRKEHPHE